VPRTPRRLLVDLGSTNHCTWRSHNFSRVFEDDDAKRLFLALLEKYAPRHGILVRSYCLMGTHPHVVVVATRGQEEFSHFWKVVNQVFARWYNQRQKSRRGQVVTQRMKSPLIQPDSNGRHILTVMRYGEPPARPETPDGVLVAPSRRAKACCTLTAASQATGLPASQTLR
jgi:putative transposase